MRGRWRAGDKRARSPGPGAVDDLGLFHDADRRSRPLPVFCTCCRVFGGPAGRGNSLPVQKIGTMLVTMWWRHVDAGALLVAQVEIATAFGAADHQSLDADTPRSWADAVVSLKPERRRSLPALSPIQQSAVCSRPISGGRQPLRWPPAFRGASIPPDAFHQGSLGVDVHNGSVLVAQRGLLAAHKSRLIGVIRDRRPPRRAPATAGSKARFIRVCIRSGHLGCRWTDFVASCEQGPLQVLLSASLAAVPIRCSSRAPCA